MHYDVAKIKEARMKLGWNQTELSRRSGLSVFTISLIESGKRQTPKSVSRVVNALNVGGLKPMMRIAQLVADDDPPRRRKRPTQPGKAA